MALRRATKVERDLGTVKRHVGLPPVLTDGVDVRSRLPAADVVLLLEEDGGFFIHRYRGAAFVGDTWHPTLDLAEAQLRFEFVLASPWIDIPEDVKDRARFAIELGEE